MNAREELLDLLEGSHIKCAEITIGDYRRVCARYILRVGHTVEEYHKFLDDLDFEYDDGYGGQELYGTVWFTDDTWAERDEYDGSEWWAKRALPKIPEKLINS